MRARVELAAYCGDEAARAIVPVSGIKVPAKSYDDRCQACDDLGAQTVIVDGVAGLDPCPCIDPLNWRLGLWLSGLSRWGSLIDRDQKPANVMVRAAVAAARVALPVWEDNHARREAGLVAWNAAAEGRRVSPLDLMFAPRRAIEDAEVWLACPCDMHEDRFIIASAGVHQDTVPQSHLYAWLPTGPWAHDPQQAHNREAPQHAARIAGEAPVRAAICSSLVSYALGAQ